MVLQIGGQQGEKKLPLKPRKPYIAQRARRSRDRSIRPRGPCRARARPGGPARGDDLRAPPVDPRHLLGRLRNHGQKTAHQSQPQAGHQHQRALPVAHHMNSQTSSERRQGPSHRLDIQSTPGPRLARRRHPVGHHPRDRRERPRLERPEQEPEHQQEERRSDDVAGAGRRPAQARPSARAAQDDHGQQVPHPEPVAQEAPGHLEEAVGHHERGHEPAEVRGRSDRATS